MTTKHSSSLRDATSTTLIDSQGLSVHLGNRIGKGGEGSVYEVVGDKTLAAKIYHQPRLPDEQVAKLETMVSRWSNRLGAISAWPRSILYETERKNPRGILMPKVSEGRHLHELYGTTTRRRFFSDVAWHHLVLAARNTAAAFHALHAADIVVGDVNQGNVMVESDMCVRLIDCDSFQVSNGDQVYFCPVGTPHFTPPELQSQMLREVPRTADHDGFGLAVLIFHLLFVGRHPFAGRFRGAGDLPIEKAIGERRFAFSKERAETLVEPPPASLLLEDLPQGLANLFELAFRKGAEAAGGTMRPTPLEWTEQLEALIKQRNGCSFDAMHVYFKGTSDCPWCRIEDEGGPAFFVPAGGVSGITRSRLEELDRRIHSLPALAFPDLAPGKLALPKLPILKQKAKLARWSRLDWSALALALSCVLCLLGVVHGGALLAGIALATASAAYLLLSAPAKQRRKSIAKTTIWLDEVKNKLAQRAQAIALRHRQRGVKFGHAMGALEKEFDNYQAEGDNLREVIVEHRALQQKEFLRNRLIRDSLADIAGIDESLVAMLESFGVETAADVEQVALYGIPVVNDDTIMELIEWRQELERAFVFKPDHGVTAKELEYAAEAATQRFKMSQARKVLMGAKNAESLVETSRFALGKEVENFEKLADQWREVARKLQDFQSDRRTVERRINSSPWTIVGVSVGAALLGWLLYWIFG